MHPSDRLLEAAEHLRIAKQQVNAAFHEIDPELIGDWGVDFNRIWLGIASFEEEVEELSNEF